MEEPAQPPSSPPSTSSSSAFSNSDSFSDAEARSDTVPEQEFPVREEDPTYYPSPRDILHVSAILASTPLPNELIDPILELAEYWACIRTRVESSLETPLPKAMGRRREHVLLFQTKPLCSGGAEEGRYSTGSDIDKAGGDTPAKTAAGSRAKYYASLPAHLIPEPRNVHPVRRIMWRIRSCDQGWGGEGGDTYENSWTGFWGSVRRYKPPVLPAWTPRNRSTDAERDKDTASRNHTSAEYLAAWTALQQKPTVEEDFYGGAEPETDAGVSGNTNNNAGANADADADAETGWDTSIGGKMDERRVWPRKDWSFRTTHIQVNARAKRAAQEHVIVWDHRDDIEPTDPQALEMLKKKGRGVDTGAGVQVRALQRGDIVELHSYAYFPGWSNTVEHAEVMIEFAL